MVVSLNMGVSPSMEGSLRVGNSTTELAPDGANNTDLDYQDSFVRRVSKI